TDHAISVACPAAPLPLTTAPELSVGAQIVGMNALADQLHLANEPVEAFLERTQSLSNEIMCIREPLVAQQMVCNLSKPDEFALSGLRCHAAGTMTQIVTVMELVQFPFSHNSGVNRLWVRRGR